MAAALVAALAVAGPATAATAATIELRAAASGSQQQLHPGDLLVITLAANLSTGYAWAIDGKPAALSLVGRTYTLKPGTGVGRSGTSVLSFRALRAGSGTLSLGYRRIWEKGKTPLRTFRLAVVIR